MAVSTELIKKLREKTSAGVMDCREALEKANGDFDKAALYLREKGLEKVAERGERAVTEGVVELYTHGDGRVGVMVEVNCETDFVARSEGFRKLAHELALQIAAAAPRWVNEDDIPEEIIESQRQEARELAIKDGKPEDIIDKIVEGRLKKFKDETCLMRQSYIRDDKLTILDLISDHVVSLGENVVVRRLARWELGEDFD